MHDTIYGIPVPYVEQCLQNFDKSKQSAILIEECAELIKALSKHDRGREDVDEIAEEISHVLTSCAVVSRIYGIKDKDIHRELKKKAKKYGFFLPEPNSSTGYELDRDLNGMRLHFTIPPHEEEIIFRKCRHQHQLNTAKQYLHEVMFTRIANDDDAEEAMIDTFGCTLENMCDVYDDNYALEYLVKRFNDLYSDDAAASDLWMTICNEMLNQFTTGKDSASDENDEKNKENEKKDNIAPANTNLIRLGFAANDVEIYVSFNRPLDSVGWNVFNLSLDNELNGNGSWSYSEPARNSLIELAQAAYVTFLQSDWAKQHHVGQASIFAPDDRVAYWVRSIRFRPEKQENAPADNIVCTNVVKLKFEDGSCRFLRFDSDLTDEGFEAFCQEVKKRTCLSTDCCLVNTEDMNNYVVVAHHLGVHFLRTDWAKNHDIRSAKVLDECTNHILYEVDVAFWSDKNETNGYKKTDLLVVHLAKGTSCVDITEKTAVYVFFGKPIDASTNEIFRQLVMSNLPMYSFGKCSANELVDNACKAFNNIESAKLSSTIAKVLTAIPNNWVPAWSLNIVDINDTNIDASINETKNETEDDDNSSDGPIPAKPAVEGRIEVEMKHVGMYFTRFVNFKYATFVDEVSQETFNEIVKGTLQRSENNPDDDFVYHEIVKDATDFLPKKHIMLGILELHVTSRNN